MATLTLYTRPGCGFCTRLKRYLRSARVPFEERNIVDDAEARQFWSLNGHTTVPQAYVGPILFQAGGAEGIESLSPEQFKNRLIQLGVFEAERVDKPCDVE